MASKFRPLEDLKRDMAQLELLVETDVQVSLWSVGTFDLPVGSVPLKCSLSV